MPDPYLMLMMHGQPMKKKSDAVKSRFDEAIDKEIEAYLDSIDFNAESPENKLLSPQARRSRMREELRNSLEQGDLDKQISTAFEVLQRDGKQALTEEEYQTMIAELSLIGEKVNTMKLDAPPLENFQTLFNISDATMSSIVKVAIFKFSAGEFENCMALFMLLATLYPGQPEYWFRLGMAAEQAEKLDFAIRAYRAAIDLDPQLIGALLFMANCCRIQGKRDEALEAYNQAKKLEDVYKNEPEWKELLDSLEQALHSPPSPAH